MPIVINTKDGQSVTQYELVVAAPNRVDLSGLLLFRSSTLVEGVRERAVYRHQFSTTAARVVDTLLRGVMSTGTPLLRFRLGYGSPAAAIWLPWQQHIITFYSGLLQSSGDQTRHELEIETSDALYTLGRSNKTVMRKGRISDMVAQIADENRLEAVIEPTQGIYAFAQSYTDDTTMLYTRLRPRAINGKSRGNYVCYVRDNVLHFHTPDYQTEVKTLNYFDLPHVTLAQVDHSQSLWDEGVRGTRLLVYDPYTAQAQEVVSDPSKALRLSNAVYNLASVAGGEENVPYTLSFNRPEEAVALGQNMYELARSKTFELVATFSGLLTLRVGDLIRLNITPANSTASPWSGFYVLSRLVCGVNKGDIHVTCSLQRGEIQQMQSIPVVQSAEDQLKPETEAPGQDLNLREAQDSASTKGVGKAESTRIYSTVVNPNSAG